MRPQETFSHPLADLFGKIRIAAAQRADELHRNGPQPLLLGLVVLGGRGARLQPLARDPLEQPGHAHALPARRLLEIVLEVG